MIRFFRTATLFACLIAFLACHGQEYFATPEKTLDGYINSRMMSTRAEYEKCLNSFRKEDREWWDTHVMKMCRALYGPDCPGEGIPAESAVWVDKFEPAGPRTTNIESSKIDEDAGTAVIVVDGKEFEMVKERGNWKLKGFFGMREHLEEQYPQIK